MKFGLAEDLILKINLIFAKYPSIEEVVIYGSRAKGNYRPGSDIDITLKGPQIEGSILSKIEEEIDDLNSPYLFDISIFNKLKSPDLESHIQRIGQVFYKKTKD